MELPRISVNKLGEYLTARPARRRRILENAKRPPDFIAPRYREFFDVAARFLCSAPLDDSIIANQIDALQARLPGTEWEEQNRILNTDLLTNLLDVPDLLSLERYEATEAPEAFQSMGICGVDVSIRPEVFLRTDVRGREVRGAIKFYVTKSYPLDQESADYIATLVHHYCTQAQNIGGEVDYRHCYVVDVPSREVYSAPRSYLRTR